MNIKKLSLNTIIKKYNLLILLVLFSFIATCISDKFLQFNNFFNILRSASFGGRYDFYHSDWRH